LAVVALAVGDAEEAFLQDRIRAVPEREREAENLLVVRDPGQTVLAPSIGARARLIVAEVVPGVAGVAVVFPHGAPLALREVRAPFLPGGGGIAGLFETASFFSHGCYSTFTGGVGGRACRHSACHATVEFDVRPSSHSG